MPPSRPGCALVVALPLLTVAAPANAGGDPYAGPHLRHHRQGQVRMLPPGISYRDPRLAPPPTGLIVGYLPRYTEQPMYNEPPNRFPQR